MDMKNSFLQIILKFFVVSHNFIIFVPLSAHLTLFYTKSCGKAGHTYLIQTKLLQNY